MIERKFVSQKIKEHLVQEFVAKELTRSGHSKIEIRRTPLGEKIIIYTSRPGLIVGKKGENIKRLTANLKNKFDMENPQIEVAEIENPFLDPNSVVDRIVYTLERYGSNRFKFIGYNTLKSIMSAGAIGAEIVIGGVGVPGSRAKSWRFSKGYLKKSGDVSETQVLRANAVANLKRGSIGVKVTILPPDIKFPDKVTIKKAEVEEEEPVKEEEEVENSVKNEKVAEKKEEIKEKEDGDNKEK